MTSTVYIAKNVYGGDGLGRLGDGRVVFVPGAWAGEQVKAEITEEHRHYVKARLVEIVERSEDRIGEGEVSIPGMVYANLSYAAELRAKAAQLKDFFDRARLNEEIKMGGEAPQSANYRNKVVYHFARQRGQWVIGYRREPTHEIVEVTNDPLAAKPINDQLPEIRKGVMALLTQGPIAVRRDIEKRGNVTVRWTPKSGVKWWVGEPPPDLVLKETTAGLEFEVPAGGFYQVNPEVGEALVAAVKREYLDGASRAAEILDLYCGVGVFGLVCKPPKLTGIESGREAIAFAKRNAARLLPAAKFYAEEVGRNLRRISINSKTTVIVDPPRGGLEGGVAKFLAASAAERIIYVSCDPATLMRDLKTLTQGYAVKTVRWFNMFPRTARFETMVVLERRQS